MELLSGACRSLFRRNFGIQDPRFLFAYPAPFDCLRTKTSRVRDSNSNHVFFHFPPYLTCPSFIAVPRSIAAYCWLRAQEITDDLVELLMQIIHRIGASAERRVERELIGTLQRVTGKNTLLCRLAETALANPDGIIREVLFPVIDEQTLGDLVKELSLRAPARPIASTSPR